MTLESLKNSIETIEPGRTHVPGDAVSRRSLDTVFNYNPPPPHTDTFGIGGESRD